MCITLLRFLVGANRYNYEQIKLDEFVVMLNHIHGIIKIDNVGTIHELSLRFFIYVMETCQRHISIGFEDFTHKPSTYSVTHTSIRHLVDCRGCFSGWGASRLEALPLEDFLSCLGARNAILVAQRARLRR